MFIGKLMLNTNLLMLYTHATVQHPHTDSPKVCRNVPTVVGSGWHQPTLRYHHSDKITTTTNSMVGTKISV